MSRTYRRKTYSSCALKNPKTFNEIRTISGLMTDYFDINISGLNRLNKRKNIPTSWDDRVISAYQERRHEEDT